MQETGPEDMHETGGATMNRDVYSSSKSNEWETPQHLYDELDKEFHFTLDPASTHDNAKCDKHYTQEENGLDKDWSGEPVFCNPPYGRELPLWIEKAARSAGGGTTVVMLIPARTDTRAFHDFILHKAEIRFLKGRLKFGGAKYNAPFPSMIVIFK
jgi:site-specific DNA-methyltransferase (adenine-specific)